MTILFILLLVTIFFVFFFLISWLEDWDLFEGIFLGLVAGLIATFVSAQIISINVTATGYSVKEKMFEETLDTLSNENRTIYLVENLYQNKFKIGDSTYYESIHVCSLEKVEDTVTPYIECYLIEPQSWALRFFRRNHPYWKKRYILHVPDKYIRSEVPEYSGNY